MANLPELKDSELSLEGRAATLTFKRDDVRNAITGTELVADVLSTVAWANSNPDVSVLVITGEGRAFSAGGNLKLMEERSKVPPHQDNWNNRRGIQGLPVAFEEIEIPVIAAINGPAIGGGFDLAIMCDVRIGSTRAQFAETYINLGLVPSLGGLWHLERLLGYQRAAELSLTGRIVSAEEAKSLGILLEVTAPEALMDRVRELAAVIAAKPPIAVRYMKRLLKQTQRQPIRDHLELCGSFQVICHKTEDHAEAVKAVLEKRRGEYKGR